MADEKQYTLIHTVVKEMKNSKRTTNYSVTRFTEEERPTATVQLKVETDWERKDGEGRPEKPELYEIPSIQLVHLLTTHGTKLKTEG